MEISGAERPTRCPKCGYDLKPDETGRVGECPICGIVFSKFGRLKPDSSAAAAVPFSAPKQSGGKRSVRAVLLIIGTIGALFFGYQYGFKTSPDSEATGSAAASPSTFLGERLIDRNRAYTSASDLADKDYILLYMAAAW